MSTVEYPQEWRSFELLQSVIDHFSDPIFVKDLSHRFIALNRAACSLLGRPYEWLIGKTDTDIFPPDQVKIFWEHDDKVFYSGLPDENEENLTDVNGAVHTIWTRKYPMRDGEGRVQGLCGVISDITSLKDRLRSVERLEAENREHLALIDAQRETLSALAVPVLRIWQGVLLVPLIGTLDDARAGAILDTMLEAISRASARFLILDVTGVPRLDRAAARALVHAVEAAMLLGCESVLVGICGTTARALVDLDVVIPAIATRGTLERGLEYALSRLSYKIVRPCTITA